MNPYINDILAQPAVLRDALAALAEFTIQAKCGICALDRAHQNRTLQPVY